MLQLYLAGWGYALSRDSVVYLASLMARYAAYPEIQPGPQPTQHCQHLQHCIFLRADTTPLMLATFPSQSVILQSFIELCVHSTGWYEGLQWEDVMVSNLLRGFVIDPMVAPGVLLAVWMPAFTHAMYVASRPHVELACP